MNWVIKKIKKGVFHKFLRKFGTRATKQRIWDEEFRAGSWEYIDHTETDPIYAVLARYCKGGDILDLGCGAGNTGSELDAGKYSHYDGVDISAEAIQRAIHRSKNSGREGKNTYFTGDIASFVPQKRYSLILFRESLFYLPLSKIPETLHRLSEYLAADGFFVVRMCDRGRYSGIVKIIERDFALCEEILPENETSTILVFQASLTSDGD